MYIPRILLCGNREKFFKKIGNRRVEIIGEISFKSAAECGEFNLFAELDDLKKLKLKAQDFQIFLDGSEISFDDLIKIMNGAADYIVFDNNEITTRLKELWSLGLKDRFITTRSLLKYARDNFYSIMNSEILLSRLHELNISRLLDVDNFFVKNDLFYILLNPDIEIEAIDKNPLAKKYPLIENLCTKIYSSLEDCRFKFFDALLLTSEREPDEFIDALIETDTLSENVLTFARKNSELNLWLKKYEFAFEKIGRISAVNGEWIFLKKFMPSDFCVYVVTHKDARLDVLPEGYKIIHAGHALAKEKFGYLGDDSGDNISHLNPYLNEITALYWIWKNTRHTILGLCHYRRFFTTEKDRNFSYDRILTETQAKEILHDCDMIIVKGFFFAFTQTELKSVVFGQELNSHIEKIFRKYIGLKHPDYLEAFEYVSSSYSEYLYEMFITRRHVFEAYCRWLFSFIIDATEEILATTNLAEIDNPRKYRSIGLVSERLMTVWLMKNRLRLKTLPIMFQRNV